MPIYLLYGIEVEVQKVKSSVISVSDIGKYFYKLLGKSYFECGEKAYIGSIVVSSLENSIFKNTVGSELQNDAFMVDIQCAPELDPVITNWLGIEAPLKYFVVESPLLQKCSLPN